MPKRPAASQTSNSLRALAPSRDISPAAREGAKTLSDTFGRLPEGWAVATIPDLVGSHGVFADGDWIESKDQDPAGDVRLVQLADVGDGVFRDKSSRFLTSFKACELACTFLHQGDILVARMPEPLGRACIFPGDPKPSVTAVDVCIIRPSANTVEPLWLLHSINSPQFRASMSAFERGTTRKRISRANLGNLPVPVPPLPEQRRIVERVEALLGRVQAARARLAKVPALLKRFRQSVLAAACSGELTAELSASQDNDGSSLPEGWTTMSLASVCEYVVDCPHSTPKWSDDGIACLRTTNFRVGKLDLDELRYVSEETYKARVSRLVPRAGDVVYSREGGILGIACTIPEGLQACLGQRMMLMRPGQRVISAFLMHVLNSPRILARVRELTGGTASPHLNVGDVKAFPVPLPPLSEQQEIVRRVEALFALADKIECRVALATERVEKTTQAILAKAFRGELVPTEAELARQQNRDYEPATALLERIRAERKMVANENISRKGARPKQRKVSDAKQRLRNTR